MGEINSAKDAIAVHENATQAKANSLNLLNIQVPPTSRAPITSIYSFDSEFYSAVPGKRKRLITSTP
jgi:hypothetical protein